MLRTGFITTALGVMVSFMTLAAFGVFSSEVEAASNSFTVQIESKARRGDQGSEVSLGTFGIPSEMQGKSCQASVSAENNKSIHLGNKLYFDFGVKTLTIHGIEDVKFKTIGTSGHIDSMPDSLDVRLEFGEDEVSSFGGVVEVECQEPSPTLTPTPTSTPTPNPTVTPTPTNVPSPTVTPTVTTTPVPTATPTHPPATPPSCPDERPGAPTLLSVEKSGNDGVQLIWSEADANVEFYMISYGYAAGVYNFGVANTGKTTSYRIGSLDLSKPHYFVVRSQKGCAVSGASNELRFPRDQKVEVLADTDSSLWMVLTKLLMLGGTVVVGFGVMRMKRS